MAKDILVNWMKNAIMMEKAVEELLEAQIMSLYQIPELDDKLREHLLRTKEQQERLRSGIELISGEIFDSRSGGKSSLSGIADNLKGSVVDKMLISSQADAGIQQFQISVYGTIIRLADKAGEQEIVDMCRDIQLEELSMADWLRTHLPEIEGRYIAVDASEHPRASDFGET